MHGKMQLILTSSFTPYFKQCGNTRQLLILYTKQRQNYWRSASLLYLKLQRRKHSQLDMHSKTLSFIDIAQSMQIILSKIVHKLNLPFFAS